MIYKENVNMDALQKIGDENVYTQTQAGAILGCSGQTVTGYITRKGKYHLDATILSKTTRITHYGITGKAIRAFVATLPSSGYKNAYVGAHGGGRAVAPLAPIVEANPDDPNARQCANCKRWFIPKVGTQKYCTSRCSSKWHNRKHKSRRYDASEDHDVAVVQEDVVVDISKLETSLGDVYTKIAGVKQRMNHLLAADRKQELLNEYRELIRQRDVLITTIEEAKKARGAENAAANIPTEEENRDAIVRNLIEEIEHLRAEIASIQKAQEAQVAINRRFDRLDAHVLQDYEEKESINKRLDGHDARIKSLEDGDDVHLLQSAVESGVRDGVFELVEKYADVERRLATLERSTSSNAAATPAKKRFWNKNK